MRKLALLSLVLLGCGSVDVAPDSQFAAGFNPQPVQAGYTRFVSPVVPGLLAGSDEEYCQWVAGPSTEERDVLSLVGQQSLGGHHAVLYASTKTQVKVGETHLCTEDDMVSFSFLGAIGGEGMATDLAGLPPGLNFRLRKGLALVINAHYVNASPSTIDGQAIFDVKFSPPSADHTIVDLFANNGAGFMIEPGKSASYDVNCTLKTDLSFAMVTNHMHGYGTAAMSELIRKDGTHQLMVKDDTWLPEQKFNPHYVHFGIATAVVAKAGDIYHTRCSWTNSTNHMLAFPTEMCAGVGFYFPGNGQITCGDGE